MAGWQTKCLRFGQPARESLLLLLLTKLKPDPRWETWPSQSQSKQRLLPRELARAGGGCWAQCLSSFCGALQFSRRKCSARIWTRIRKSEALHSICEQATTITHCRWLHLQHWLLRLLLHQYRNEKFTFYLNSGEKQQSADSEPLLLLSFPMAFPARGRWMLCHRQHDDANSFSTLCSPCLLILHKNNEEQNKRKQFVFETSAKAYRIYAELRIPQETNVNYYQ